MANSFKRYTGDGSTTDFSVTFPYLDKAHVGVKVDGSSASFTWFNDTTVRMDTAPANGSVVEVRRTTPVQRIVDFQDGAVIIEENLDDSAQQALYLSEEASDDSLDALRDDGANNWDGQGKRLTDIADPTSAQDVATKNFAETGMTSQLTRAEAEADDAATSASAAATSETNAASSASAASTSESNAATSESNAATSESNAASSASAASTSENNAATSESNAASSAGDASDSATEAQNWATYQEDSTVPGASGSPTSTDYSALHWASKAGDSASSAATSESNAAGSEANASQYASAASSSATAADNAKDAAKVSETNASTSETNAATSATNASSSATESEHWSNYAEDSPIPEGNGSEYSAYHWAQKALDAASETNTGIFSSRTALATSNVDPGVTHVRTAGYAASGDGGGGLYDRAGSEPAHALKVQSFDGAWWELVPDSAGINVRQAGATGDGVTDDSQAFKDALAGVGEFNSNGTSVAVNRVIVPPGDYNLGTTTLELKKAVNLTGLGSGMAGRQPAILRWDANVTGIIVHRSNTIGAGVEGTPSGGADGSIIEGLELQSAGGTIAGVTDATKGHGIWIRTRAILRNLIIRDFAGNGVHIVATSGGADDVEGNANEWNLDTARIQGCHQNGVYIDGADVNAGYATKVDVTGNGRWGIYDSSFLGNTHIAHHSSNNGVANKGENGAAESSYVVDGLTRYSANVDATEADLVATQPGTDEDVWIETGGGASVGDIPNWQSGQPEGTYFHGGSYHTDNANAHNTFLGCYNEINHARPQLRRPTTYFAGDGFEPYGNHGGIGADTNGINFYGRIRAKNHDAHPDAARDLEVRLNNIANAALSFHATGDSGTGWAWKWDETHGMWILRHADLGSRTPINLTTNLSARTYGRSAAQIGTIAFEQGFWVGNGFSRSRWIYQDNGAPTSGAYAKGDLILNYSPDVQTDTDGVDWIIHGWRCTTSGSPGTWSTLWVRVSAPPGL